MRMFYKECILKRISLLIKENHHESLNKKDINISGLVRDLLDDHFSDFKITIGVSEKTRNLYDQIVANTGSTDEDIEVYFRKALKELLNDKISAMKSLHANLEV
jgi:hypothetical protein